MKKTVLFIACAISFVLLMLALGAYNVSAEIVSGSCGTDGSDVTWVFDTATGILSIKGSGKGADYSKAAVSGKTAPPWRKYAEQIKTVSVIGLSGIGEYSFAGCEKLTTVTLSDDITVIPKGLFYGCVSLKNVAFPTELSEIEDDAFYDCLSLEALEIPTKLSKISERAFVNCSGIKTISVAEGNLIYRCDGNCLIRIADSALIRASAGATVPTSVKVIASNAFSGFSDLTNIVIPDTVIYIGYGALSGCTGVIELTLPFVGDCRVGIDGKPEYISDESAERNKLQNCLWYIFGDLGVSETLEAITVTDCVTIGLEAFAEISSLKRIELAPQIVRIDSGAFYKCSSLQSLVLPQNLVTIGDSAFYECRKLEEIFIPDNVSVIGEKAFFGCASVKDITLGRSVSSIGEQAFVGCILLDSVTVSASNAKYKSENNCLISKKENVLLLGCKSSSMPNGITEIGDYAFKSCAQITELVLPSSVKRIGKSAFEGCISLTSLALPNGLEYIGDLAFADCRSLKSLTVPESVSFIGDSVFKNCTAMSSNGAIIDSVSESSCAGCSSTGTVSVLLVMVAVLTLTVATKRKI